MDGPILFRLLGISFSALLRFIILNLEWTRRRAWRRSRIPLHKDRTHHHNNRNKDRPPIIYQAAKLRTSPVKDDSDSATNTIVFQYYKSSCCNNQVVVRMEWHIKEQFQMLKRMRN